MRHKILKRGRLGAVLAMFALAGCTPQSHENSINRYLMSWKDQPVPQPAIRQPVLPEMLVNCRGHVLVPALGMKLLFKNQEPPDEGQYLREEKLSPPYRIIRPGAPVSREMSPTRLNIELDGMGRIIGLYCG